jgi:hypothetical protein
MIELMHIQVRTTKSSEKENGFGESSVTLKFRDGMDSEEGSQPWLELDAI